MGTHMVHQLISRQVADNLILLNAQDYLAGAMAPDSGVPVPGQYHTYDPPKRVTHFYVHDEKNHSISDKLFYERHGSRNEPALDEFKLGYYHHLLIDNLWAKHVNLPLKRKYAKLYEKNPRRFWNLVMDSWWSTDRILLKERGLDFLKENLPEKNRFASTIDFIENEKLNKHISRIEREYEEVWEERDVLEERLNKCWNREKACRFIDQASDILLSLGRSTADSRYIPEGSRVLDAVGLEPCRELIALAERDCPASSRSWASSYWRPGETMRNSTVPV